MTGYKWVRFNGSFASAALMFLLCIAGLVSKASSQSVEDAPASGATSTFVAARSFAVSGTPTSVMTADLNRDGKLDLIVTDAASGKVTVFFGAGGGKFDSGTEYATGLHPDAMAIGDIDGDGRQDIVVADSTLGTVTALFSDGNGKLQSKGSFHLDFDPAFVASGDFNGAGKTDFAVLSKSGKVLATLMNDGRGSLVKSAPIALAKTATSLTVADFNHDGRADLALANADGTISILLGKGDGNFRFAPEIHVSSGTISSITIGDFNRDGKIDLAITEADQRMVSVLLGNGDGGFSSAVHYPVGSHPVAAAVADFDEDGIPDLIVVNRDSNTFSILAGIGDGGFKASQDFIAGKEPVAVAAGDFAGNGHIDLAFLNASSRTISVPLGNGDGTFQAARSYATEFRPRSIASGDLNGDGKPDLVVINSCGADAACAKGGSATVFLAGESGYKAASTYTLGAGPVAVALADVNGDKILDIVALNRSDKTVSIQLGLGDGRFQQPFTFTEPDAPVAFAVGDLNHDGNTDLAVVVDCGAKRCSQRGSVDLLLGAGDGTFHSTHVYPVGYAPSSVAIGDVNRDGSSAIVVANRCGKDASCNSTGSASIFIADKNGRFQQGADLALGKNPRSVALADLSGSGVSDLVVSHATDNAIAVYRNDGKGSFQTPNSYAVGAGPRSVAVADFNGDGIADVAVSNYDDATVSVLFGRGDGTLQPAASFPVGAGPDEIVAIAGRGHASLATANGNGDAEVPGSEITVLENVHAEGGPGQLATKTKLSLTASVTVNAANTLTATVSSSQTSAIPTGTVAFTATPTGTEASVTLTCSNASTAPSTVKLNTSGVATCQAQPLPAGSYSIKAHYSGDANFAFSDATPTTQAVKPGTATLTINATPGTPYAVGETVTLSSKIPGIALTPIAPSGKITINVNGTSPAGCSNLSATGTATCQYKFPSAQSYVVQAIYLGTDANFTIASSANLTLSVGKSTTAKIALSSGTNPSFVNETVAFAVTVTPPTGSPTPGGTAQFFIGATQIPCQGASATGGTVSLAGGTATCNYAFNSASTGITITAKYSGDANYPAGSATPNVTQVVSKSPTTVSSLISTPNPSSVDGSVTFTATVTPQFTQTGEQPLDGTVTFTDTTTGTTLCPPNETFTGGVATCITSFNSSGPHTITAVYNGNTNYAKSPAAQITQNVGKATPTAVFKSSVPNPSSVDEFVTFTATIAPVANSKATSPGGTVTFSFNENGVTTTLCSNKQTPATVGATTTFSCSAPMLHPGTVTISANYSGDNNFNGVGPFTANQTVNQGGTAVTAPTTTTSQPIVVNQPVSLSTVVSLSPFFNDTGLTIPSGMVTFADSLSGTVCNSTLNATGVAPACSGVLGGAGLHSVTATYDGDANFKASLASSPLSQKITQGAVSQTLASNAATVVATNSFSLSSVVSQSGASNLTGTISPGGQVSFTSVAANDPSGSVAGACTGRPLAPTANTPRSSTAGCTVTFPSAFDGNLISGTVPVTTTYAGDGNFTASTGSTPSSVTVTVQNFSPSIALVDKTTGTALSQITLVQQFNNINDPFAPSTITLSATSLSGFSDSLTADPSKNTNVCKVIPLQQGQSASDISCLLDQAFSNTGGNGNASHKQNVASFKLNTMPTAFGPYTVVITPVDANAPALLNSQTFTVNVVQAVSATVFSGGGPVQVTMVVPAGISASSLSCGANLFNINTLATVTAASLGLSCSNFTAGSGGGTVTFTLTKTAVTAQNQSANHVALAAMLGTPLMIVIGLLTSAGKRRKAFLRFFGLAALIFAGLNAIGCGGGFNGAIPTSAGSYDLQIVSGGQTQGIVQLTIPR